MKKLLKSAGVGAALAALASTAAHAGTSGTEFEAAYNLVVGWIEGYLGRAIAIAFFVIGIFMGVARQNLMAGGVAVAAAFAIQIMPGVLDGVLTGTVTEETVLVEIAGDTADTSALDN